jgi:hypothetical protein
MQHTSKRFPASVVQNSWPWNRIFLKSSLLTGKNIGSDLSALLFMRKSTEITGKARNTNNYGRALMSAPPQAMAPNPHTNSLNIYIYIYIYRSQIKWGFDKKMYRNVLWSSEKIFESHQLKRKSADSAPNEGPASTHIPTTSRYHETTGDRGNICPPDFMSKCSLVTLVFKF